MCRWCCYCCCLFVCLFVCFRGGRDDLPVWRWLFESLGPVCALLHDRERALTTAHRPTPDVTSRRLHGLHIGWSLGEQNAWCKMTNWENGVRVPLIFRPPGYTHGGAKAAQLAEAVDIYRTLADLSGIGAESVRQRHFSHCVGHVPT